MVTWVQLNLENINRIGYNKEVKSLFIDFTGSKVDSVFLKVPESVFKAFSNATSHDRFYEQFVEGYFAEASFSLENKVVSLVPAIPFNNSSEVI